MKTKNILAKLPQIMKYGSGDILLQSSIKPQFKITTPSAIKVLKQVAFHHKIVSLSANQIGLDQRIFVALKPSIMKAGKWKEYQQIFQKHQIKNPQEGYQAIINPIQINSTFEEYYAYEECPSFPGLKFKVKMPLFVNVKYIPETAIEELVAKQKYNKTIQQYQQFFRKEKVVGWKGRVWDHQIRHLQGLLAIQHKICEGEFYLLDQFKGDIDNIQYFEKLKAIDAQYSPENLKKLKKLKQKQLKARKQSEPQSQSDIFKDFTMIPEQLSLNKIKEMKKPEKPNSPNSPNFSVPKKNKKQKK